MSKLPPLNFFQNIAATGLVISMVAHVGLYLSDKAVPNFWYVYLTWVIVFIAGTGLRYTKWGIDDHHHHHHDHDEVEYEDEDPTHPKK